MRAASVRPTGVERTFGEDELIVSKTDAKGVIRYANRVFLRVSGLTEHEAIGQPHNIVRHPDMPRCVFHVLWDRISSGHELFAYILNLAKDGAHYWVFAHVTPSYGARGQIVGYHSNRRCPDRSAVAQTEEVYARLRAQERQHARPAEALAASGELLNSILAERRQSFDEWVWQLTAAQAAVR